MHNAPTSTKLHIHQITQKLVPYRKNCSQIRNVIEMGFTSQFSVILCWKISSNYIILFLLLIFMMLEFVSARRLLSLDNKFKIVNIQFVYKGSYYSLCPTNSVIKL